MNSPKTSRAGRGLTSAAVVFSVVAAMVVGPSNERCFAQDLSALQTAVALEKVVVDAIAASEKSVVAIGQFRRYKPGKEPNRGFRTDPFSPELQPQIALPKSPKDLDFIPTEYGTGVVLSKRGLILTNSHVLSKGTDDYEVEYWIVTADHKSRLATIKATDPRSDLAVLEIDATDLTPITLGDATSLKKGQIVITLGNPYAIARDGEVSASWGIVSNLSRKAGALPNPNPNSVGVTKPTLHHFGTLIQTDAKLNLGTSGGALINLKGEMVGLTTSAAAAAGFEQAAGYAIPVDDVFRRAIKALQEGREVEYGFLGISPGNEEDLNPTTKPGMRVGTVVSGTPAARAGLVANDFVTHVNEQPVRDADSFFLLIGRMPADERVKLTVVRADRPQQINVLLSKYPVREKPITTAISVSWRGVQVEHVSAQANFSELSRTGHVPDQPCVVVASVDPTSPAAKVLKVGQYISHIGIVSVETPKGFYAEANKTTGAASLKILAENRESDFAFSQIKFKPQAVTVPVAEK